MDKLQRRRFFELLGTGMLGVAATGMVGCADSVASASDPLVPDESLFRLAEPALGQHIAMLVYPQMTMLDLLGPHTCFVALGMTIHLVWKNLEPLSADTGVTFLPTTTFDDCPQDLEILFVPGSTTGGNALVRDREVLSFVRSRGERAKLVTSVCTGSLVLGAAGLLRGYKATSHWLTRDLLSVVEATPVDARYVVDRNRVTGAGVTSGLDFGLRIIERLRGRELAELMQLMLEYAPEPPFDAGHPSTAPASEVLALQALFAPSQLDARLALLAARAEF